MGKNLLLAAASLLLFFALLEGSLALLGVRPILYSEDPFVGFESRIPLFVEGVGPDGERVLETAPNKLGIFNAQRFPAEKPAGAVRIFCLGGSTTYGRPYDDRTSFCGWLRALLPVADPGPRWEVINAGGISYASYRVAAVMEELVRYQPDVFVIYTGHNEFLERRTYGEWLDTPVALRRTSAWLSGTRTYTVLSRAIEAVQGPRSRVSRRDVLPGEVEAVLDRSVGPADYHRDDALRRRVVNHFQLNLERMVEIGRSAGAAVVLVAPASNLGHCAPFKSEPGSPLDAAGRSRLEASLEAAREALRSGDPTTARVVAEGVLGREPRHAEALYLLGIALREQGHNADARDALVRARDEDVCPLRAPSEIVDAVAAVAAEHDVAWIDFPAALESRAGDGIPGEDLFLDHVHPTIEANRVLALALVETLAAQGVVEIGPGWDDAAVEAVAGRVEAGLGREDRSRALANLGRVLAWAGKLEEAHGLALRALELVPDQPDARLVAAGTAYLIGRREEAVRHYEAALPDGSFQARDHANFAAALEGGGDLDRAETHYRAALALEPDTFRARLGLARVLVARGGYDEAVELLGPLVRESPDSGPAHLQLGIALAGQGDHRAALRRFETVVKARPGHAEAHRRLADSLEALGRAEQARSHRQRAAALDSR